MTTIDVLLIEDDLALAETTQQYLENFGFVVRHAADGEQGIKAVEALLPDIVLLDLMLPGIDGLEISRLLRADARTERLPILMLTARGEETDRVVGLELGADDYLTKPFSLRELVARIRAILRRASQVTPDPPSKEKQEQAALCEGGLQIDQASRTVCQQGQPVDLTATEFDLLWLLASRPGQVLTREQLLDSVRGREFESFDRSIDVHISKLRKKLEKDPKNPKLIHTVWGVGYRFTPSAEE